jgi:hypothetical protein
MKLLAWAFYASLAGYISGIASAANPGETSVAPTIRELSPNSGPVGTWVTIQGERFTSANVVQFRGERISFASGSPVASNDRISLRFQVSTCPSYQPLCPGFFVPPGNYKVTVTNSNGASNEGSFAITTR